MRISVYGENEERFMIEGDDDTGTIKSVWYGKGVSDLFKRNSVFNGKKQAPRVVNIAILSDNVKVSNR